jgi:amino acid transporter
MAWFVIGPDENPPLMPAPPGDEPTRFQRLLRIVVGRPRDLSDQSIFHRIALIPFLAWVGLGADGLSSSSYGPEEAFRALGTHTSLAVMLAVAVGITVLLISAAYSRIIEEFPHGGGGYVVATKLLGAPIGVVSGAALVVDYMLTITVSIAAAGDALFSLLPLPAQSAKLAVEGLLILLLTLLNLRGVRESAVALAPVFVLFLVTHLVLIGGTLLAHVPDVPAVASGVSQGIQGSAHSLGVAGMLLLVVYAYSLGGGTYTGIEAVSNGVPLMREPRVATAKRTMVYMASSLAFTAAGLVLCYLLLRISPEQGKTMNAVLAERFAGGGGFGFLFVTLSLVSEGALLVVAGQAGFIDGPRVLANMAIDSWVPHRFSALSDRLTTHNGVIVMAAASLAALLYTRGDVGHLVVMYSINVFVTFSLSMLSMLLLWWRARHTRNGWKRKAALFASGFVLCATILTITVLEKFREGGWITLVGTGGLVALCFAIRSHYRTVGQKLASLDETLIDLPAEPGAGVPRPIDPMKPTAAVLVTSYGGLGIHTVLGIHKTFPNYFQNFIFLSVGVIDSGEMKGEAALPELTKRTEQCLQRYVGLAGGLGLPAAYRMRVGTEVVEEVDRLAREIASEFPHTTFFSGQLIFRREAWYQRLLHNETAFSIQKRLQWRGQAMVILPVRVQ